jgi:hypothetical protein
VRVKQASVTGLALTPFILQKSRMRRRARTDLCGGRSAMVVPTATILHFILTFDGASRRRWKCRMGSEENIKPFLSLPPTLGNRQRTTISHIPTARLLPHYNDISALHQHNCTRYRCPSLGTFGHIQKLHLEDTAKTIVIWRRERDSNPRYPFG